MEVCRKVGISRATLLRWIKQGILQDVRHKDRNGWRLFTEDDINRIRNEATRMSPG
jgi:DNA-binding transcriptional MerR regulator